MRTEAFLTDMDAPLGRTVGNALEIAECVDTLKGRGPDDLTSVVTRLAARMTALAGLETTANAALARATNALSSGRALEVFARMIERQGGDPRVVDDPEGVLPRAPVREPLLAHRTGVVAAYAAEDVGHAAVVLGAGRLRKGDRIDPAVGIVVRPKIGDRLEAGEPIGEVHARDADAAAEAARRVLAAIDVTDGPVDPPPLVHAWL